MAQKKQKQKSFQQYHLLTKCARSAARIRLPEVAVLSEEERSRLPRARAEFAGEARRAVDLAKTLEIELPGFPLEALEDDLAWAEEVQPVRDAVADSNAVVLRALDDTLLARRSRAWSTFLFYYAVLAKMAETNPIVAERMKPVIAFMAHGKRAKNEDQEPEPTQPVPVVVPEDDQ